MRVVLPLLIALALFAAAASAQQGPSVLDSLKNIGKKASQAVTGGATAFVNGVKNAVKAAKEQKEASQHGNEKEKHDDGHDWGYEKLGADWGDKFKMCNGPEQQSPILLKNFKEEKASTRKPLELLYKPAKDIKFLHNGHTWQASGDFGFVRLNGKKYNTVQFHLHWKSEHAVGSETRLFDGEIHIVHQWDGVPEKERLPHGFNDLLVTGFFVKVAGKKEHDFLKTVDLINGPKQPNTTSAKGFNVDATWLMKMPNLQYYTYPGSLTTPKCNPTVIWHVFSEILPISTDAYNAFKTTFGDKDKFPHGNRRALQPRLNTTVVETNTAVPGKATTVPAGPEPLRNGADQLVAAA